MKKNILILIIILIISVFIYGVFVGTYKIFPYDELNSVKSITLNEKTIPDQQNTIYENNVSELIQIKDNDDISKLKNNLIDFIWKNNGFPNSKLPASVNQDISNSSYSILIFNWSILFKFVKSSYNEFENAHTNINKIIHVQHGETNSTLDNESSHKNILYFIDKFISKKQYKNPVSYDTFLRTDHK